MSPILSDKTQQPWRLIWGTLLVIWLLAMCSLPDPRPLSAPNWSVGLLRSIVDLSESNARLIATIMMRAAGIAVIGILLPLSLQGLPMRWSALIAVVVTPLLAIGVKWISFGFFPIPAQRQFIVAVSILSALFGLALLRSRIALAAMVILSVSLLIWGTATGVRPSLEESANATGNYLLEQAAQISDGDLGFRQLLQLAFAYAEDNSHSDDPIEANQAAILALGVILGNDQVAKVGRFELDDAKKKQRESLRNRITMHGRGDLPRHFSVSAALTVLSDENRALAVGIAKEVSDSAPGGSGFSFIDMVANKFGIRLASLATQDKKSARLIQRAIIKSDVLNFSLPAIDGFPEGITTDQFQAEFGGLSGRRTRELFDKINRRVDGCFKL